MMGRRPKRSDHAPNTGEKINCMAAHANPKYPVILAALAMLPPLNCMIRLGRTGAIMPRARKSNRMVIKIKINAAWPKREAGESGPGAISPESLS